MTESTTLRPICCLGLLPALLAGCLEQSTEAPPLESVERIVLDMGHEPEGAELGDEARPASAASAGVQAELCLPEAASAAARRLVLPIGAKQGRPRASLALGEDRVSATGGDAWSELVLELAAGVTGCVALTVDGEGSVAWLSDGLLVTPGRPRPWVVVYVVDSLRYDRTPFGQAKGEERAKLAPAFETLARDGLVYDRAVSSSSWTRPAVASILTGLGPSAHRVLDRQDRLPAWAPRLQQAFADAGWLTVAVSSNPNILPVFGFLDGFDRFVDVNSDGWLTERGYEGLGSKLLELVRGSTDVPLFLYVHDNEPHLPYRPLERYRAMFGAAAAGSPAELPDPQAGASVLLQAAQLQRAAIRSTSDRFGALMDALRRLDRYEDAVVVLTADHGEEFGEHGGAGHGHTLFQEQLHVPLVLKPPLGSLAPGRVSLPTALEGIASTVVALAGVAASWTADRPSLPLARAEDGPAPILIAELDLAGATAQSALRWPWKLLRTPQAPPRLFDLSKDPREQHSLGAHEAPVLAALESVLDDRLALARGGLEVSCVAGDRLVHGELELELELDDAVALEIQRVGFEIGEDVASIEGNRLRARLQLRPAEQVTGLARFDRVAVARQDPDRDRIRVPQPPGATLRVHARGVRLEGPDGVALPADGTPIALASIELPIAPGLVEAGAEPRCAVFHIRPRGVQAAEADAELEARLRALGYL
ncbi:MAG: sulfatase [Myxococcota bacterium]|nr:sulfatase [Myxococcota bacterium]